MIVFIIIYVQNCVRLLLQENNYNPMVLLVDRYGLVELE